LEINNQYTAVQQQFKEAGQAQSVAIDSNGNVTTDLFLLDKDLNNSSILSNPPVNPPTALFIISENLLLII